MLSLYEHTSTLIDETFANRNFRGFVAFDSFHKSLSENFSKISYPQNVLKFVIRESQCAHAQFFRISKFFRIYYGRKSLREKCPNPELFLVRIQENTGQK